MHIALTIQCPSIKRPFSSEPRSFKWIQLKVCVMSASKEIMFCRQNPTCYYWNTGQQYSSENSGWPMKALQDCSGSVSNQNKAFLVIFRAIKSTNCADLRRILQTIFALTSGIGPAGIRQIHTYAIDSPEEHSLSYWCAECKASSHSAPDEAAYAGDSYSVIVMACRPLLLRVCTFLAISFTAHFRLLHINQNKSHVGLGLVLIACHEFHPACRR